MPLFGKNPADTQSTWEPQAADSRLAHTAGADPAGVFTSDLSVSEYVLLGEARLRAARLRGRLVHLPRRLAGGTLGPEPGTAGPQPGHVQRPGTGHVPDAGRVRSPRRGRDRRRAAPVADVRLGPGGAGVRGHRDGGQGDRGHRRPPRSRRRSLHLGPVRPGLLPPAGRRRGARGLRPRHLRLPHRPPVGDAGPAAGGQNQEMVQFTQGVYDAREISLSRMQAEAAAARASGIVGVDVAVSNHVWGEHATEFLATGTAIRRLVPSSGSPRRHLSPPSPWASTTEPKAGAAALVRRLGWVARGCAGSGRGGRGGRGRCWCRPGGG